MSHLIRHANENDAEALFAYLVESAGQHGAISRDMLPFLAEAERDYIRHYTERANSALMIAIDGERVLGTVTATGEAGLTEINLLVSVHPAMHGLGLGMDLIRSAINWARLQGSIWRVNMAIDMASPGTIRLYERLGFVKDSHDRMSYTCYGTTLEFRAVTDVQEIYRAS